MNTSMMITIDGVGPIAFEKSKRARHVNISVAPSKLVRVAVPQGVSYKKANEAVRSKLSWIRKHSQRMEDLKREHASKLVDVSHISYGEKKKQLIQRVIALAKQQGFNYNKIFIRKQRTRWGSCSSHNNISLNI